MDQIEQNPSEEISTSEETKYSPLFTEATLREFEVSIIARFLTAKEKLQIMALLNRSWNRLVSKHYAWTWLPERGPMCLLSDYLSFLENFTEFSGLFIPEVPSILLSHKEGVSRAHLIRLMELHSETELILLKKQPKLQDKLFHLSVRYSLLHSDQSSFNTSFSILLSFLSLEHFHSLQSLQIHVTLKC